MYEDRYVAFIDILGFKNQVKESATSVESQIHIKAALRFLDSIRKTCIEKSASGEDFQFSNFSDSAVISCPIKDGEGLFFIIEQLSIMACSFACEGFLLRGAVTSGKLYHKDVICFGPAMVSVIKLEEETAIYPRIIVEDNVLNKGIVNYKSLANSPKDAKEYLDCYIKRDFDYNYIDFFASFGDISQYGTDYDEGIYKIRSSIVRGLADKDEKMRVKYKWLKEKYNMFVKRESYKNTICRELKEKCDVICGRYNSLLIE